MPIMKRLLPLLCLGWISACINVPEIEPPNEQPPGPADSGVPTENPGELTVVITSPTDTVYTSTTVTVSVEVQGGSTDTVQLLKGDAVLATLSAPFQYTWDTTGEAEGRYALTARATREGKSVLSAPVTVVVDRAHPQVVSRSPANGSSNVDFRAPIQVVFTKPVKASTILDTTVSLAVAGVLVDKTLSLSSDGLTLTITPRERPSLPATFSLDLSRNITDLAGNALVMPSTPWSFDVPDWLDYGGPLQAVGGDTTLTDTTMILDKQDNPIVAWSEELTHGGKSALFIYHWDGQGFTPMGGALNGTSTGSAFKPSLALDGDGRPVVAWQESDGFNENIYVRRWTGTDWQTVGTGPLSAENDTRSSPVPTPAINPSLAVRGNDIYVAWEEMTIDKYSVIHVWKSSNGGAFSGVGSNGGTISAVPKQTSGSRPSLVLDSNGLPIVAFAEQTLETNNYSNIYVMRLLSNENWDYAVPPFSGNDASGYISGGLTTISSGERWVKTCSLTIDAQDNLYLAWEEESYTNGPVDTQVFRSTGAKSWERLGSPLSAYGSYSTSTSISKIRSTKTGKIFISWQEFDGNTETGYDHLFSSFWDGSTWINITSDIFRQQCGQSLEYSFAFAVDAANRIVTTCQDSTNLSPYPGINIHTERYNQ